MLLSQVTTAHLRRVFQVDPDAVWLQDDLDDTAYFPTDDGTFIGLGSTQCLYVEGPPMRPSAHASTSSTNTLSSTSASAVAEHTHPQFRSVVSGLGKRASPSAASCRVKVVKADVNWNSKTNKPSFTPSHQAYIEVQESTATVDYTTDEIRKWGDLYVCIIIQLPNNSYDLLFYEYRFGILEGTTKSNNYMQLKI